MRPETDIDARLESAFAAHRIVRLLRDVPPHEVWEVRVDGRRAVYKADTGPTGSAGTEGRVIDFVRERTSVPVPEILSVGDDYYVAAWHADAPAPGDDRPADRSWARAAGRGLATLHDETAPEIDGYGRFRTRDDALAVAGRDEWHAAALKYVRGRRSVLARYGHAETADAVVDFLTDRPDAFAGAGDPVCCHGWATPAHVSVDDGDVTCVVDFEHAVAAPGEFDYWRTVLPTFDPTDCGPQRAFREGYESVRPFPEGFDRRAPLYVLLNEVYYLESLHVQDRRDAEETARRAAWFRERIGERLDELA